MEKAGAIFEGKPPVVQRLETPWSRDVQSVKFMVDSDQDQLLDKVHSSGNDVVKHACNLLQVIGLSSA